MVAPAGIEPA